MYLTVKHIAFFFCFVFSVYSFSQSKVVTGKITDFQELPIEGSAVVLYDIDKKIIAYAITDHNGVYELEGKVTSTSQLEITHISFIKKNISFRDKDLSNETLILNSVLEENTSALDEVILISSLKVKDTVKLDLKRLNLREEDNLKDILNKIPNFRLSDDGVIIYKGKSIDKILVNNKPSFENQNSIALESIENKIIEGISVINNYNDDFSLDFEENEESVLNIDTKNKNQQILDGSIETKYGYKDKYEFKGKGFLFSQNLNAFLTHNTNNIGKTTIKAEEVKKLFTQNQPFSLYQGKSLERLFATNENLKKDFFTSTNLTLRNQTQRLKTSGLFYHIAPNRINSVFQNVSTLSNVPLLNTTEAINSKSQSFLSALSLAYKLSNKTIGTYTLNANYIDDRGTSDVENELFDNGNQNGINTSFSNSKNRVFSGYHQFSVKSKVQKNLILETGSAYYHERTKLLNDYSAVVNTGLISERQKYFFTQDELQANVGLKYRLSDAFIPFLSFDYKYTTDAIENRDDNISLIERKSNDYLFNMKIKGKDVFKKFNYEVSTGVNSFITELDLGVENNNTFIPVTIWVDYEKRMHRYYVSYLRSRKNYELESGIRTVQAFNNIWNGNIYFPLNFQESNSFTASYNYDNLFDAKLFSVSFTYNKQKNVLRRNFLQQQNGISEYELFVADNSEDFKLESFYSKTLSPLKYPTKVDVSVSYKQIKYPIISNHQSIDLKTKSINPKLQVETITDKLINFKLSSQASFVKDEVIGVAYNSVYTSSDFSVIIKNDYWKGAISFLYDNNKINDVTYSRKNINLNLSYLTKAITYSIEARHIGELLSVFNNESYGSQFTVRDGLASTIVNDRSLSYLVLGIKFKL